MNNNNLNSIKNTLWNVAMFFFVLATISTLVVLAIKDNNKQVLVSETGCCSITIHNVDDKYLVTWQDNLEPDGFQYSEVTNSEDLEWIVNECQDFCYTHHNN